MENESRCQLDGSSIPTSAHVHLGSTSFGPSSGNKGVMMGNTYGSTIIGLNTIREIDFGKY
jgi:hypothetical protein